jgi:hypothetical protein
MLLDLEGALQVLIEGGRGTQGVQMEEGGRSVDAGGIIILKRPKVVSS